MTPEKHQQMLNESAVLGEADFVEWQKTNPCSCGRVHKGDYGLYDYWHHMCPHTYPRTNLMDDVPGAEPEWMCGMCGLADFDSQYQPDQTPGRAA
jgi:hypothetical protein